MTLVWLAAAFILGIFAGWSVVVAGAPLFVGVAVLFVVLLVIWRRPKVRLPVLATIFLLLGAGRSEMARVHIGPHDVACYNGQAFTLTGYVNTEPDVRDTGNNYVIAVDHVLVGTRKDVLGRQVELHTAPGQVQFDEGDEIQFTGCRTRMTASTRSSTPARSPRTWRPCSRSRNMCAWVRSSTPESSIQARPTVAGETGSLRTEFRC